MSGCDKLQGNHNNAAHSLFAKGIKKYVALIPNPRQSRNEMRSSNSGEEKAKLLAVQVLESERWEQGGSIKRE